MVSMDDSKWGVCSEDGVVVVPISFLVSFDNLESFEKWEPQVDKPPRHFLG